LLVERVKLETDDAVAPRDEWFPNAEAVVTAGWEVY
jgi:hypothetical protein